MNNARKTLIMLALLIVIISTLVQSVLAQENVTNEDIIIEAQRSLDRSLNILNIVVFAIGVMATLLAVVIAVVGGFGLLEIKGWQKIRKDTEKKAETAKKTLDFIEGLRYEAEMELDKLRHKAESLPRPSLTEKPPSEEILKKLDEFNHRLELLKLLGATLKPEDYFNHGRNLFYKGKYEDSLQAFEKAIASKSDYADAWSGKGAVLSKLGRNDEALEAIEKAIELKVNYSEGWYDKGYMLTDLGRYDEALKAYKNAIEIKQDYASAWYNIACIYSIKGEKENALFNLKKAIEIDISCKEEAKKDEEFKKLRDDEDFKKMVG